MSASDNFSKDPADETDIDQLVRVMKELENAFRKVSLISDQLSQVTFRDMFKTSLDFMKLEKQRYQDAKKHDDNMSKIDKKTPVTTRSKSKTTTSNTSSANSDEENEAFHKMKDMFATLSTKDLENPTIKKIIDEVDEKEKKSKESFKELPISINYQLK